MTAAGPRPLWMILGVDIGPDGVTIWFSDTPMEATVDVVRREPSVFDIFDEEAMARDEIDHILFTIKTKSYRWVKGATYEEAFRRLFDSWTPTTEPAPAIAAAGWIRKPMTSQGDTFTRLDKRTGERTTVTRKTVMDRLSAAMRGALDAATEAAPVETPFALYWPTPSTESSS